MQLELTSLAAMSAVAVSVLALWSNPERNINRVFFSLSLHAAAWLVCLSQATKGGEDSQLWMRFAVSIGGALPLHLWLIKETIATGGAPFASILRRSRWWVLGCAVLVAIPFTQWFVPTQVGSEIPAFGSGYYAYTAGALAAYVLLCHETLRQMRATLGVTRVELQLVLLGGSSAAGTVILLMALRAIFVEPWLMAIRPLVVLLFYSGTVIAITTARVLNARQLFTVGLQRLVWVCLVTLCAVTVYAVSREFAPELFSIFIAAAVSLWFAGLVRRWLDGMLRFYPQDTSVRQAAFTAAQRETKVEKLEATFRRILKGWGQAEHAMILSGGKDLLAGEGVEVRVDGPVVRTMRHLRWATPERLMRERSTPERVELARFLAEHRLGVLVIEQGPSFSVLLGVAYAASRRPYTYPQVTQLMELASIMESALERAHFSVKVQHTEQLATVGLLGASLAHEIRNPLVSIKTFVQLLPTHHQDPVFREKFFRLIGDEVGRIDQLTEQLLDLASPRAYCAEIVHLHPLLEASLDLVSAKASHKNVQFLTEFEAKPDSAYTDASAAKQVMLNLCFNAIQAVEGQVDRERWVKVATCNTDGGVQMIVADSGPGISPEIRPRLFQPFQTSKSTGFGLGLAICRDILANLNASISVDPPAEGQGATFRVTFPCRP